MSNKKSALLIFSKNPVEGKVKTRLIPELGTEGALHLYKDVLKKTIESVKQSKASDFYLFCTPVLDDPFLQFCSRQYDLILELQNGDDLGDRMSNAISKVLKQSSNVIIVGCDCPELTYRDINIALEKLTCGIDVVLGPSEDGGYYLIGMNKLHEELFQNIQWGKDSVLADTREIIETHNLTAYELEMKWDLDRPEDVHRYFRSRRAG